MTNSTATLFAFMMALEFGQASAAAECPAIPVTKRLAKAEGVLLARVIDAKPAIYALPNAPDDEKYLTVTLTVIRSWKGSYSPGASLIPAFYCAGHGCAVRVSVGDEILIFSQFKSPITLQRCSVIQGNDVQAIASELDAITHR